MQDQAKSGRAKWGGLIALGRALGHYRRHAAAAVVLGVISAFLEGVSIALLLPILQGVLGDGGTSGGSGFAGWLSRSFRDLGPVLRLRMAVGMLLAAVIAKNLVAWFHVVLTGWIRYRARLEMVDALFRQFLRVSYRYIAQHNVGDLGSWISMHTLWASRGFALVLRSAAVICVILIYAVILLIFDWKLTLLAVILVGLLSVGLRVLDRSLLRSGRNLHESSQKVTSFLYEILGAMREVRIAGREQHEMERNHESWRRLGHVELKREILTHSLVPVTETLITLLLALFLLLIAPRFVQAGGPFIPIFLVFLFILMRLQRQVGHLNQMRAELLTYLPSADIVAEALSSENKPYLESGQQRFERIEDSIRFENVSYAYADDAEPALAEVSFEIPRGKTVALVGSSGAGKSTIVDLLIRLDDPSRGRVLVDELDLREVDIESWRAAIGMVAQEPFLFNATVTENIRYGKADAGDDEVIEAAKRALVHDFVSKMPAGYDSRIGDRGVRLSGGQRQRIAIARALLRRPALLVLDEATSSLDSESERMIQRALEGLPEECTVVVIAHRLSTIERADRIVVVEEGRVVETGTHQDLIGKGGRYARLRDLQHLDEAGLNPPPSR